ncbi:S41 family peptidase [Flavobacterium akiainvivens]|uniref:S41 family peptidase n=1 Tax=Flavobacterium akiainvivens TaxID=1202724 RepID=UPI0006C87BEB|nr:S41 family peptidase [Flavobacterium akiainvivens]SFQ72717.1 C-terminal processing protease CtpA/Prc, contains a PDZ domain [Flavobacterium akiainvivens]
MTKPLYRAAQACLFALPVLAQDVDTPFFNLDYEITVDKSKLPLSAHVWGKDYIVQTDATVAKSGTKSVLIQKNADNAQFGCIATAIPAVYEGQTILLTGWMKLEGVTDGNVGLLLRIDGANDILEFENMDAQGINGTSDWAKYEIELPLPKDAQTIYVGALNGGSGKLWVDDLKISIDGKDISKATKKVVVELPAQKDKEFDGGSKINAITLTPQKTQDLKVLGLVWGYLKYYHPAIAAGNHNWDYELFRIVPKVLEAKNAAQRDAALLAWAKALGPFEKAPVVKSENVKLSPDLDWITTSGLSPELSTLLTDLKSATRTGSHYYIGLAESVQNPEFKNENPYKDMDFADAGYRLLGLYRYWNIIQYYFPNRHLIGEDWKGVLEEFIPKFVNVKTEKDYKLAALELIGRINDTHANVYGDPTIEEIRGNRFAAEIVAFTEGKPVVTRFMSRDGASVLQKGDVITAINGTPVDKLVQERLKYNPASNQPTKMRNIARALLRSNNNTLTVDYTRNGKPFKATLPTYTKDEIDLKLLSQKKDTCFKMLSPKIAYMYPGTIKNEYIPQFFEDIKNTDGLVIDLRCYPSDFIVLAVGEMIAKGSTEFVKWSNPSITTPGEFSVIPYMELQGRNNYKGKVVVLVNEVTQSMAEYSALTFRAVGAKIVGSTTSGADGNISPFYLPGNVYTVISGIGVYYPDGGETQRVGIVPDIEVKPTVKGITDGRDEVLEKAVEFINKK